MNFSTGGGRPITNPRFVRFARPSDRDKRKPTNDVKDKPKGPADKPAAHKEKRKAYAHEYEEKDYEEKLPTHPEEEDLKNELPSDVYKSDDEDSEVIEDVNPDDKTEVYENIHMFKMD